MDLGVMGKMDLEEQITERFVKEASLHIGPGRRWPFKKDFCEEMGMVYQEWNRIETLKRHLQYRHLVKFHELVGADMNYLILGKKVKPKNNRAIKLLQEIIQELR